jgi:release factor glutamine methyltransferase
VNHLITRLRTAGCVFAEEEAALLTAATDDPARRETLIARRITGEPLEHVLGWAEFCGLRVTVTPGVFVPRRRTEHLVRLAAAHTPPHATVVDLACGSGALGLALHHLAGPLHTLHAVDVDPAAAACAARNLAAVGGHAHHGDLYAPLPPHLKGGVHVLLANVPYVPTADLDLMPREAREHEPAVALDGGTDGLDVLRRVAARAVEWLAPGGCLLTEAGAHQADTAAGILTAAGLVAGVHREEDAITVVGRAA